MNSLNINRIVGVLFGLGFVAVFAGWVDLFQGFNESAEIIRNHTYNSRKAGLIFAYAMPFVGVAFLLVPEFLSDKLSPLNGQSGRALLPAASWQILGYILLALAFLVLWVFANMHG